MAFLHRAGATSFSFLRVIQGTQQTLWSTAQWPRKKTRHTMSFTHTHIQRHAHYASPPLHSTCACTQKRKVHFHLMKVLLSIHFGILFCLFNIIFQLTQGKAAPLPYVVFICPSLTTDWPVTLEWCPTAVVKDSQCVCWTVLTMSKNEKTKVFVQYAKKEQICCPSNRPSVSTELN